MPQRAFRHSTFVGSLLLLDALCSCVAGHDARVSDGTVGGGPQSDASAPQDAARPEAGASDGTIGDGSQSEASATQDAAHPEAFEPVGVFSCQSTAPFEFITDPPCSDQPVACDASLVLEVEQLLEGCSYLLIENSFEVFIRNGCVVGVVEARDDRNISDDARRCVRAGLGRMHTDCLKALCIRVERSTLAAL
jgi:hypothetical protein